MADYQKGDPLAAAELVERLSPPLYRFFSGNMGRREEAHDMLQEAWMRIHRLRHTYRPGEPLLPWVYAIARRVRVDDFRRRARMAREVTLDGRPDPESPQSQHDPRPAFDELVAELPESQREVLTMLKVEGLSLADIARATSSTVGAVKQKAHRAYERLRCLLEDPAAAPPLRKGFAP